MHELAICESLRSLIEDQARLNSFSKVRRVTLEIGPLSGVEVEAIRFSFDVAMQGSVAQSAQLDIVECAASAWCLPCGSTVSITERYDPCPRCGSHQLQITAGEELRIRELEVD